MNRGEEEDVDVDIEPDRSGEGDVPLPITFPACFIIQWLGLRPRGLDLPDGESPPLRFGVDGADAERTPFRFVGGALVGRGAFRPGCDCGTFIR